MSDTQTADSPSAVEDWFGPGEEDGGGTAEPAAGPGEPEEQAPASPRRWWYVPLSAAVGATLFGWASLTPSLLPRSGVVQGLVTGVGIALGYAMGLLVLWLVRQFTGRSGPWYGNRPLWITWTVASLALLGWGLYQARQSQDELAELMGMPSASLVWYPVTLGVAVAVAALIIAVSRLVRRIARGITRFVGRWLPARTAWALGVIAAGALTYFLISGVLLSGLLSATEEAFKSGNSNTSEGIVQPDSDVVSGSPDSAVAWQDLGQKGRDFVGKVPTAQEITDHTGRDADDPIRVYAGLDSSEDAEERAALAVADLKAFGAFDRDVLAIGTTTGTGWVDEFAVQPLEYLYDGNTATVATQYSYLPSWISFLVDKDRAKEAGITLLDAVYAEWEQLPRAQRPLLVVFGESLGSFGGEAAFSGLADIVNRTDGALFIGPPNSNDLWQRYTQDRDEGSREVLPVYRDGEVLRWAQEPEDLAVPGGVWNDTRMLYLQNASDPIVWWSPRLLTTEPDWLAEPRGRDVLGGFTWYPLVTFFQVSADMMYSTGVPYGHGHVYQSQQTWAWAELLSSGRWSDSDVEELAQHLQDTID